MRAKTMHNIYIYIYMYNETGLRCWRYQTTPFISDFPKLALFSKEELRK